MASDRVPGAGRRRGIAAAVMVLALAGVGIPALAAPSPSSGPPATTTPAGLSVQPTASCPQDALDEINEAVEFVRGQTWADEPGRHAFALAPDVDACRVVLDVGEGHLSSAEKAALQAGAGSRLAIEYRRDWARPSRVLLILWVIFGGSGVVWVYRRYARR